MSSRRTRSSMTTFAEGLEENPTLGELRDTLTQPVTAVFGDGPVGDLLRGRSMGHALHPVLVQVPLGAMLSAVALDLTQGKRAARQSRFLIGLACLGALPAVASGLAEWTKADDRTQRVGVAHAGLNAVATATAGISFLARLGGWSRFGAATAVLSSLVYGVSGSLGGHLSLVRKFASHDSPSNTEGFERGRFE